MKQATYIVPVVILLTLLALFYWRASQTKAYMANEGKLPEITAKDYSKSYLYKGRKVQPKRTAIDTNAVDVDSATLPKGNQ